MISVSKKGPRGESKGFTTPLVDAENWTVRAVFGPRPFASHLVTTGYDYDFHRGIDFQEQPIGTPCAAIAGGQVVRANYSHFHWNNNSQTEVFDFLANPHNATIEIDAQKRFRVNTFDTHGTPTDPVSGWVCVAKNQYVVCGEDEIIVELKIISQNIGSTGAILVSEDLNSYISISNEEGTIRWRLLDDNSLDYSGSFSIGPFQSNFWIRFIYNPDSGLITFQRSNDQDGISWDTLDSTTNINYSFSKKMYAGMHSIRAVALGEFNYSDEFRTITRFGNWVSISNTNGKNMQMHMDEVYVKQGETVAPGQIIGTVGKTGFGSRSGRILSAHTHYEHVEDNLRYYYNNNDPINPLAPNLLPRENINNNVVVNVYDEALNPNGTPAWHVNVSVAREDQDFDLNEIILAGSSATRSFNLNTRAGLNTDVDIPINDDNSIYLVANSFDENSTEYELDCYFTKSIVGSGSFELTANDAVGNILFNDTFSFIVYEPFYGSAGGAGTTSGLRYAGGGGGGATEVGGAGTGAGGGQGGDGIELPFAATPTAYGGGGGGGACLGTEGEEGAGGFGGGGRGGWNAGIDGEDGVGGTGGGGGGGGTGNSNGGLGGDGGDGIVLIRYEDGTVTATGGAVTNFSAGGTDYTLHTFSDSADFVVSSGGNIDYLIVGGGGGGGGVSSSGWGAGGGGAGAIRSSLDQSQLAITAGTYRMQVGRGGQGGGTAAGQNVDGVAGGTSSAFGIIARGGGGGSHGLNSGGGGRGGCGGGGARGGAGGASVELADDQYSIRQYFLEDATITKNTIGATIGKHAITMPGGSAAANADDANALVLEWDLVDIQGNVIGVLEHPYDMVLGALRLINTEPRAGLMGTDLFVSLEIYFPLDALNVDSEGGSIGCALSFADASSIAPAIITKDRNGNWSTSTISGSNLDSSADANGALLTWTTQPAISSSRGARSQGFAVTYASYDRESWGQTIVITSARRQQAAVPVDMHNKPVLRLAVVRTSGSAGDLTFEPRMFSEVMVVQ